MDGTTVDFPAAFGSASLRSELLIKATRARRAVVGCQWRPGRIAAERWV